MKKNTAKKKPNKTTKLRDLTKTKDVKGGSRVVKGGSRVIIGPHGGPADD